MRTLAIDLGGSRAKMAIVTDGVYQGLAIVPVDSLGSMRETLECLAQEALRLMEKEPGPIDGVGLSFPGIVRDGRIVESNGKYADASQIDPEEWAQKYFHTGIKLINDAAAALEGELRFGVGQGADSAVMMILGTGVGTAAAADGRVLVGKHGTLGILGGHIAVETTRKRRCTCGNMGCLEAWAGTWALKGLAQEEPDFADSVLAKAEEINYRTLYEGALAGDPLCVRLFDSTVEKLCVGAVNLIHAYDPEVLILSGGASHIPQIGQRIQEYIQSYAWTPWGTVEVRRAENPEASVLLGLHAIWLHS